MRHASIGAMFNVAHEFGVALLFIAALLTFCVSLLELAREPRIALQDNDLRVQGSEAHDRTRVPRLMKPSSIQHRGY